MEAVKEFILSCIDSNNYLLVSFIMLLMHCVYSIINHKTIYAKEIINEIIKVLRILKRISSKMANRIENLINTFSESNRTILYIATIYLIYLIPVLRWILIISIFTTKYRKDI